jgi:hypothetical protein
MKMRNFALNFQGDSRNPAPPQRNFAKLNRPAFVRRHARTPDVSLGVDARARQSAEKSSLAYCAGAVAVSAAAACTGAKGPSTPRIPASSRSSEKSSAT